MIKFCVDQWSKNKQELQKHIQENLWMWNEFSYKEIVEKVVDIIFNGNEDEYLSTYNKYDHELVTEIDNGDYQGTLVYLIPLQTYQPSADEYLMTHVYYGSCSGCDTLQSIQGNYWDEYSNEKDKDQFVKDMMKLCLDLVQNTIKPYNSGWRKDDKYNEIEEVKLY